MAYVRKTYDVYEIWGNYGYGDEFIVSAEDIADAKRLLKEYRENEPGINHRIKKKRYPKHCELLEVVYANTLDHE